MTCYRKFKMSVAGAAVAGLCALTGCSAFGNQDKDARTRPPASAPQPLQVTPNHESFSSLSAGQWIDLSSQYHKNGEYLEAIGAAQSALYLKPDYAEAYNNIGAAYASLNMWDPAIQAAQQALHLKPDFQLARNNLAWALQQKQLAAR
jgi:tetratricopeptide (TPR) repeat protein